MSPGVLSATMNWLAVALPVRQFRDSSSPWTVRTLSPWQLRRCRTDLQEILRDAGGDPRRRGPDRIPRQMRIPGGGPDLAVPEQLGDHGQALAQRQRPRREGMPAVVNPDVLDPRTIRHGSSRLVMCVSGFWPGITQGLPGTRGRSASTFAAGGDIGCQRRRKNVPARRRKNVLRAGWELVPVVHGRDPRAGRRALRAAGGGPRVGGACGPTGPSGGLFGRLPAS